MESQPTETGGKKLFTPGPICVSMATKKAMLRDLGSREPEFIHLIRDVRDQLVQIAGVSPEEYTCIPLQGSGTYSIEAVLTTTVHREKGKVLVLENGSYGRRQADICRALGLRMHVESFGNYARVDPARVQHLLTKHPDITHVGVVHSETSTGAFNPIEEIGRTVKKIKPGIIYFVDAMSSFGAVPVNMQESCIDFLVSSPNKALEGVPGWAYTIAKTQKLLACKGQSVSICLDLVRQYEGLESNGQFRFTPPTHTLLAFQQALKDFQDEGGVPAREARYKENNRVLREGMADMGFREILEPEDTGYIVTSFYYPTSDKFDFTAFYDRLYEMDQVIYPGKLLDANCFRLGNIGQLFPADMKHLLDCIRQVCQDMDISLPLAG